MKENIPTLNRRGFLKLSTLLPLLYLRDSILGDEKPIRNIQNNKILPNIVIMVLDALSAKHISLYGYTRQTTPNINRFANHSIVYNHHYSAGNFTLPGTASLLTGTYPWSHRGYHLFGTVLEDYKENNLFTLLYPDYYTVAYTHNSIVSILLHQFSTAIDRLIPPGELALVSNIFAEKYLNDEYPESFWSEIFLRYEYSVASVLMSILDDARIISNPEISRIKREHFPRGFPRNYEGQYFLMEDAINWLQENLNQFPEPYLCYFHLYPPHDPYVARNDFIDIFDDGWKSIYKPPHFFTHGTSADGLNQQRRYYDEYLAYADSEFGRFYDSLKENGNLDNTYIILTSDHGEMFERGIRGHLTQTLFDPIIHVPLIIHKPGNVLRKDIYTPTNCVDLLPTLLNITKHDIPEWCEGEVLPEFSETAVRSSRNIYSIEAKSNPKLGPLSKGTIAYRNDRFKLIHYLGYPGFENKFELFDLVDDPDELVDRFTTEKSIASDMQDELRIKLLEVNHSNK
jgi:arylsulfatase A-like enzyme